MQILAVQTATPKYSASIQEVSEASHAWLGNDSNESLLFNRYLRSSGATDRRFVLPPQDVISLRGAQTRARLFEQHGAELSKIVAERALVESALSPSDIDALIFTSCSCPLIPSPDTFIIDHLGLRRDILRIPIYQYGCAGGIIGLGLAHRLSATSQNILLVSTELCSLVFQASNLSPAQLVGASLFADGSAAVVVSNQAASSRCTILAHRSFLLPKTRHLMGYDIKDDGSHLLLDKSLPQHLAKEVPSIVDSFLASQGLSRSDIPWWLFHPGGTKILASLQEVLGLGAERCRWAGDILHSVGNMSSATILFVLKAFLDSKSAQSGDKFLMIGVGPGLTVEVVLGAVA